MKKYLIVIVLVAIAACNPTHPVYDCSKRAARQSEKHAYKSLAKCPDAFVDIYSKRFAMQSDTVYSSVTVPGVEVVRWDTLTKLDTVVIEGKVQIKERRVPIGYITRTDIVTRTVTITDPTQIRFWQNKYAASEAHGKDKDELIGKLWVGIALLVGLALFFGYKWLRC